MNNSEQLTCQNCGSVDDFSTRQEKQHLGAYCNGCGKWIKWLPQDKPKFYFGKYKETYIHECSDLRYLEWFQSDVKNLSATFRKAISERISELQYLFK